MSTTKSIKRKRISKKNKSAWRKTDINDVENFLETQRQEERIGSVADKKDEELFTIDVIPQNKVSKRFATQLTQKQKRKLNAAKPLRTHAVFENTSKVQDPIIKRNKVKQKKSGRNIEEEVRNPTRPRHFIANKDRALYYKKLDQKGKTLQKTKDIWIEEDFRDKIPGLKDEKGWISRDLALHVTKNIGKPVVKVHDSIRHRTTKAKNFEKPHPGLSYNPAFKDHQALLKDAFEREEKIIKEEEHLKRVTTAVFKKVTPEERDLLRFKEMSGDVVPNLNNKKKQKSQIKTAQNNNNDDDDQDNVNDNKSNDDDDDDDDNEEKTPYKSINPPVENKKKTKQTRNKQLKQKELEKKQEVKKVLKKQIADINRIKSIKSEVIASENDLKELKKRRKKTTLKKKFEPKRLGRLKYEEPEIDVNMPEDIAGNIRNIKTESSLLIERFKNFQKRNILAKSIAVRRPKKEIKRFVRSSHKEPGVSFDTLRRVRKTQNLKIIK